MSSRCPTLGGGGGSGVSRWPEGAGGQGRGQRSRVGLYGCGGSTGRG